VVDHSSTFRADLRIKARGQVGGSGYRGAAAADLVVVAGVRVSAGEGWCGWAFKLAVVLLMEIVRRRLEERLP